MSFSVNDPFLYLLSAIIVVFVVAQSAFFLVKANRRAQQMGIAAATVRKTILSSALFSIAPAISILVGVITLSNFIGLPFPWLRLSVLGAVTYELPAATIAAGTMGASVKETITDPQVFAAIAWTMTLGIISGIVLVLFGLKRIRRGMRSITGKDKRWGEILCGHAVRRYPVRSSGLHPHCGGAGVGADDGSMRRAHQGMQDDVAGTVRAAAVHALRHGAEHSAHGADGMRRDMR